MDDLCVACGMPMFAPEDHADGNPGKNYCQYCARPDGTMCTYDETLDRLAAFAESAEGMNPDEARTTAAERMAELPAWRNHAV